MIGALLIGAVGSLHCVGMCGPVMLAFGSPQQKGGGDLYYIIWEEFSAIF